MPDTDTEKYAWSHFPHSFEIPITGYLQNLEELYASVAIEKQKLRILYVELYHIIFYCGLEYHGEKILSSKEFHLGKSRMGLDHF